jgi:hypothetical protein
VDDGGCPQCHEGLRPISHPAGAKSLQHHIGRGMPRYARVPLPNQACPVRPSLRLGWQRHVSHSPFICWLMADISSTHRRLSACSRFKTVSGGQ